MTTPTLESKIRQILVEALNCDEGDVTLEAALQRDLGAESIDFLDIVFRMEREFSIKIPRGELFPEGIFQGDPAYIQDGRITPLGLEKLKLTIPHADFSDFEKDPLLQRVSDLFTVGTLVRYISKRVP